MSRKRTRTASKRAPSTKRRTHRRKKHHWGRSKKSGSMFIDLI